MSAIGRAGGFALGLRKATLGRARQSYILLAGALPCVASTRYSPGILPVAKERGGRPK